MEKQNSVSLWLGYAPKRKIVEDYVAETFLENGDMTSIFMKSYKIDYIDNQFMEVNFLDQVASKTQLLGELSYSEAFIDKINFQQSYNYVIALYNFEYNGSTTEDKMSKFIGSYEY